MHKHDSLCAVNHMHLDLYRRKLGYLCLWKDRVEYRTRDGLSGDITERDFVLRQKHVVLAGADHAEAVHHAPACPMPSSTAESA